VDNTGQTALHSAVRSAKKLKPCGKLREEFSHVIQSLVRGGIEWNHNDHAWTPALGLISDSDEGLDWIKDLIQVARKEVTPLAMGVKQVPLPEKLRGKTRIDACSRVSTHLYEFYLMPVANYEHGSGVSSADWQSDTRNDAHYESEVPTEEQRNPVHWISIKNLLYNTNDGPWETLDRYRDKDFDRPPVCSWIHLPANNVSFSLCST
jgi:hypothetical protein